MKTNLLLWFLLLLSFSSRAQAPVTLVQESFELVGGNDGEGSRYFSNHFETSANQYFKRSGNPVTVAGAQTFGFGTNPSTILNVHPNSGGNFWAAEGVRGTSATTPSTGSVPGRVTLAGLNVSSYTNLKVQVAFADARGPGWTGRNGSTSNARAYDHLRVQYSFDNASYTTIGDFAGTGPSNSNSDWVRVGGNEVLSTTLTDFEFPVGNVGTTLYVRVEADYSGSNKEIAFDNIRVIGTPNAVPLPTLTNIEGTNINYAEGGAPVQVTNTLAAANPSGGNLTGATVQIQNGSPWVFAPSQDVLAFTPSNGISGTYNATTGLLALTRATPTSAANFEAVLRTVTYWNSNSANATPGQRRIVFTVMDGSRSSATQARIVDVTASLNSPAPLTYTEAFESDGEGTRYGSNSFSFNSQAFTRIAAGQPTAYTTTTFSNIETSGYWYAEGTKDNITLGTLLLAPVNATNYHDLHFQLRIGQGGNGWETDDYVKFYYNKNDGSGWQLFGAFYGVANGALRQDADLNGAGDTNGTSLTNALQNIDFTLLPTLAGGNINFKVEVANNGGEELAFDYIRISGISNRPPVIAAQTFSLPENSANATMVGTVAASDPDAGQTLAYAITGGNTGGAFAINASTGQLTVASTAALNYETTPSFALTVRVTDNGTPTMNTSATITVNLTNVNEAPSIPTDTNPATNTVAENAANGTLVGITAFATDPEGAAITYSLTDNAGGRFAINASTGVVTVANGLLLDFETNNSHSITVRASDGTLTSSQSFTIVVTDVPNAAYVSSTTEQITRGVVAGTTNQAILRIPVVLNGNTDQPLSATAFSLTTTGTTTPANVAVARIYYTGASSDFATGTLFGSVNTPVGAFSISGSQVLQPGTNYFWLAYDVAANAAVGNLLDATLPTVTVGGTARTPTVTAPAGARPVVALSRVAGSALRFSGSAAGYVDLGTSNSNLILGTQYTQELWVKPAAASGNAMNGVLGYDPGNANQRSPYISISQNNRVEIGFGTGTGTVALPSANNTVTQGQWNYVVATFDGTTLTLYVNGEQVLSSTPGTVPTTTPVRYVGTLSSSASTFFPGDVDEVAQWSRALSQSEIRLRRHLVLSGTEPDLVSYMQFNEASGNVIDPISGATGPLTGTGVTRVVSTAPISSGVCNRQTVASNGSVSFTGTRAAINFTGVSGSYEVVVARLDGRPQGTAPTGMANTYNTAYWIINKYSGGNFSNAAVTYTLSNRDISTADAASPATTLRLLKRTSNSDGAFDAPIPAVAANAAAGTVQFNLTSFSQTVIGTLGTSPLPVELVSFVAERRGEDALLTWATASEKNNAYFAIESSADGRTFRELGQLPGHGNTSQRQEYAFTDHNLARYSAKLVYYRLRQVDLDGTSTYSPIRTVEPGADAAPQLLAYPNPAHDAVRVRLLGPAATAPLLVFDALGRQVRTQPAPLAGTETMVPLTGLPTGVYVLRCGPLAQRLTLE